MDHADARALVLDTIATMYADLRDTDDADDTARAEVAARYDIDTIVNRAFLRGAAGGYSLHPRADHAELWRLAAQHRRELRPTEASDLPCPEWCDLPAGHPFDRYTNSIRRDHVHRFSDNSICADVELRERATAAVGGLSDLRTDAAALLVRVHVSDGIGYLTGASARRLAAQLLDAADLYDAELARIGAPDPLA